MKEIFRDSYVIIIDTIILAIFIVVTAIILVYIEAAELIHEFSRVHENWELDEIILTIAISSFYLFIYILRRFSELEKSVKKANNDSLLDVYNRRKGTNLIVSAMKKPSVNSSLIMFDIDNFKSVNDTYGHNIGDYILKEIVKIIKNTSSDTKIVRWGGEEFILLCSGIAVDDAYFLAEKFRAVIEEYKFKKDIKITASFGVLCLDSQSDLREQIDMLDKKMYTSKTTGKNRIT